MPTVIARMHVHSLRSSKTYLTEKKQLHTEMLAQKIVSILPRSSMPRPVLRSFVIECNVDRESAGSIPLSCLTRAAERLPGIVKRTCSPSPLFHKASSIHQPLAQSEADKQRLHDSCRRVSPNAIIMGISASQENTPPLKRQAVCVETIASVPVQHGAVNQRRNTESRVLRPRAAYHSWNQRASSRLTSPLNQVNSTKLTSPYLLSSSKYPPSHFDARSLIVKDNWPQEQIEVPSWRVNDIIADQYSEEAGTTRILRSRNSQSVRVQLPKRSRSSRDVDPDDHEDTSNEAYMLRHARLEAEEIKRERLFDQRIAEEELKLRIERRERESWRKRQITRVDSFTDIDPGRFMPTSLVEPLSKLKYIHVRDEIPVIAFGVRVPKPKFGSFSLS